MFVPALVKLLAMLMVLLRRRQSLVLLLRLVLPLHLTRMRKRKKRQRKKKKQKNVTTMLLPLQPDPAPASLRPLQRCSRLRRALRFKFQVSNLQTNLPDSETKPLLCCRSCYLAQEALQRRLLLSRLSLFFAPSLSQPLQLLLLRALLA